MKKLLLTITDQDEKVIKILKEIYNEKTETKTIKNCIYFAYDSKESIQKRLKEEYIKEATKPNGNGRIGKKVLDELDEESRLFLIRELYDELMNKE